MRSILSLVALAAIVMFPAAVRSQARRPVAPDDHSRLVGVSDPQRSPDGAWVAYTVSTVDVEADKRNTDVWMVRWDGSEQRRLTFSPENESSPRWSPAHCSDDIAPVPESVRRSTSTRGPGTLKRL